MYQGQARGAGDGPRSVPDNAGSAGQQASEVTGPVADDGHRFLRQGRKDELTLHAIRQNVTRVRINDLGIEMILPDDGSILRLDTFAGHAGAHDFGQTIDVGCLQTHSPLDFGPHPLRPGLRSEDADTQGTALRIQPLSQELLGNRQHVGRRHHDDVRLEVANELDLSGSLAT